MSDTIGGASFYSLLETCKANGVDTYPYLVPLFKALPHAKTVEDHEALLAWRLAPAAN